MFKDMKVNSLLILPMAAMSAPEEQQLEELNAFLGPSKYRDELRQTVGSRVHEDSNYMNLSM